MKVGIFSEYLHSSQYQYDVKIEAERAERKLHYWLTLLPALHEGVENVDGHGKYDRGVVLSRDAVQSL